MSVEIDRHSWCEAAVIITDDEMEDAKPIRFMLITGSDAREGRRHVVDIGGTSTAISNDDMLELLKVLKEVYEK